VARVDTEMLVFMRQYADACHFLSDASVAMVSIVATAFLAKHWKGL